MHRKSKGNSDAGDIDYQQKFEREFIRKKREHNDAWSCLAWTKLRERFGQKISQEELLSLARVVSNELEIDLSREYKRRKELLIIWFNENFDRVWPFIEHNIIVLSVDGEPITGKNGYSPPVPPALLVDI